MCPLQQSCYEYITFKAIISGTGWWGKR